MVPGMTVILGVPGAALTTSDLDADLQRIGIEGEKKGAAALEGVLGNSKAVLAHSLKVPGSRGDIDHLILAGDRAIIVDSKLWSGHRFQIEDSTASSIELTRDGEPFAGGSIGMPRQITQWAKYLRLPREKIHGVLLVPRHRVTFSAEREAGVTFATLDSIDRTLQTLLGADADASPAESTVQLAQEAVQLAPTPKVEITAGLAPLLVALLSTVVAFAVSVPVLSVIVAVLAILLTFVAWDRTRTATSRQCANAGRLRLLYRLHIFAAVLAVGGAVSVFL